MAGEPNSARRVFSALTLAAALATATQLQHRGEGKIYRPYYDGAHVLTVCEGHTGRDIDPNHLYTEAECEALSAADRLKAQQAVVPELTQLIPSLCLGAVQDFALNVGQPSFRKSTLLKKLNAGDIAGAADEFLKWHFIHRGGQLVDCTTKQPWCAGIPKRRAEERLVCRVGLGLEPVSALPPNLRPRP